MPNEFQIGKIYTDSNGNSLPNNRFRYGLGYAVVGVLSMLLAGIILGAAVASTVITILLTLVACFGVFCIWRGFIDKPIWFPIVVILILSIVVFGGLRKQYNDHKTTTEQKEAVTYQHSQSLIDGL